MRVKKTGVLVLLLLAPAAVPLSSQTPPPRPGPANFRGRVVVDSVSTPIPGAFVELVGTVLRAVTDSVGGFSIVEVPAGSYVVRVRAAGFLEEFFEIEVVDGADLEGLIALKRAPHAASSEPREGGGVWEAAWPSGPPTTRVSRFGLLASPFP